MKILSVIPVMGIGGAETVAAALIDDSRRRGHTVCLASGPGFRADALARDGVPHLALRLNSRRISDLGNSVGMLRANSRRWPAEVIHAHNVKASVVARLGRRGPTPIITTLHGVPANRLALSARILCWSSERVVAVSPFVREQIVAHGFPENRITVIENSIAKLDAHQPGAARARLGLSTGMPVVLCLARMVDQKRHDLLLHAWQYVRSDAMLLLAGDGPKRFELEAQATRLGLGGRVKFLGERTDADWLLAAADLMVLPTDWEGLPISLLEAMGLGVPVVVSRVGGVIETLGAAVRLAEPDSVEALTEAIGDLLGHSEERARLGTRGQTLVAARYDPDRMLTAYDEIFRELASSTMRRNS